ncbi:thaumatin-like protein 1 [Prunus avium]|uniref:Thaumatin-like protein 1 n=1 Tax=Prunus avium TaxID=42229 RepID=A0A6P5U1P9_PRUAV|nr:thaumatin-like protein 1 [Prunus avium]
MILGDVEEIVTSVEIDDETYEEIVRVTSAPECSTDASGKFTCATADCGSGQVSCNGNDAVPPATLVEITIAPNGGQDFYDVSLVNGFNLPMAVAPQGGTGECKASTCPADVNAVCPAELQVKGSYGSVIACALGGRVPHRSRGWSSIHGLCVCGYG